MHPDRRTAILAAALIVAATALIRLFDLTHGHPAQFQLSWLIIAGVALLAEFMELKVEFRHEVFSFTFGEIPLVLGLFLASPIQLFVGSLVGSTLFRIFKKRQRFLKVALNFASFYAECVVMLTVYHLVGGAAPIDSPRSWIDALIALAAADLVGYVAISTVVRWHGEPIRIRSIVAIGALTAPVSISLGLTAGVLLTVRPWATLLLGGVAAFLVLSYRSYSALTTRFDSLSLLYEFTRLVSGPQQPDVVLEAILTQAKDLLGAERAEIWLADDRGGLLGIAVDDHGRRTHELPPGTGAVLKEWFRTNSDATIVTNDASRPGMTDLVQALQADECVVAPITEAGAVIGLVAVVDRFGDLGFRPQDAAMFATLAKHASVALENGRLIVRVNEQARQHEHESLHDALTGLPNRVLFGRRLNDLVSAPDVETASVAVALIDLDDFKDINDTLGHHAGDRALREVADRIRRTANPSVMVARLGGDEFALLFRENSTRDEVLACAHAIKAELLLPTYIDGTRITFAMSIGVAFGPLDGTTGAVLLERADAAMYDAKSGSGGGISFYHPDTARTRLAGTRPAPQ
jgi:diguanylate cyclase (GGDEF)-like protein